MSVPRVSFGDLNSTASFAEIKSIGQTRSFDDGGSMSGLPESGYG
jgi:hypothetical protein